jgi:hypothetical protein
MKARGGVVVGSREADEKYGIFLFKKLFVKIDISQRKILPFFFPFFLA